MYFYLFIDQSCLFCDSYVVCDSYKHFTVSILVFLYWFVESKLRLFFLCQLYILQVFSLCCLSFESVYGGCGAMEFLNIYVLGSTNQRLICSGGDRMEFGVLNVFMTFIWSVLAL